MAFITFAMSCNGWRDGRATGMERAGKSQAHGLYMWSDEGFGHGHNSLHEGRLEFGGCQRGSRKKSQELLLMLDLVRRPFYV
jgi:hypothetical protein